MQAGDIILPLAGDPLPVTSDNQSISYLLSCSPPSFIISWSWVIRKNLGQAVLETVTCSDGQELRMPFSWSGDDRQKVDTPLGAGLLIFNQIGDRRSPEAFRIVSYGISTYSLHFVPITNDTLAGSTFDAWSCPLGSGVAGVYGQIDVKSDNIANMGGLCRKLGEWELQCLAMAMSTPAPS